MALNTYNNNDRRPSINIYTPISWSNPGSQIQATKFSISYFNQVMQLSIAQRVGNGRTDEISSYDNDNAVKIYISYRVAKMIHDGILKMMEPDSNIDNICVETKNGLLKVSNGVEYGSDSPCIAIIYADKDGNTHEAIYQTKNSDTLAYNYSDGQYSSMPMPGFEINAFIMVLEQYYLASSYAVAASVQNANLYRSDSLYQLINSIAVKTGAREAKSGSPNSGSYRNQTFLNNNSNSTYNGGSNNSSANNAALSGIPKEYQQSSFDDIVASMG